MIPIANRLNSIQEYYFSQKLREIDLMNQSGPKVLNLGIGSPDLAPHPDVVEALAAASRRPDTHAYQSYRGAKALREAMAGWYRQWYGVNLDPESQLLPLIGSKEGITHICMTYLNDGDAALVPDPGYPAYSSAVKVCGAYPVSYHLTKENDYQPDFEELTRLKQAHPRVKLMFVNYPHMPTGQLPTRQLFDQLVSWAQRNRVLLVHDNPYSFILNPEPMSLLASDGALGVALELNSLSKSHNMAGWRVGVLAGDAQRINEVLRFKSNLDSGMFLPVQLAAARALQLEQDWYDNVNEVYRSRRQRVFALLDRLDCSYSEEQAGMFVWASVPQVTGDGFALTDKVLTSARVFITPGGIFGEGGRSFVRVSLCSPAETFNEAIRRIEDAGITSGILHAFSNQIR